MLSAKKSGRQYPVLIISGLSGAGKSSAVKVFEDLRFYTVDGLPASLVPKLADLARDSDRSSHRGLVVGLDLRQGGLVVEWQQVLQDLEKANFRPFLVFIEAREETLLRRYATTRRPHPMEADGLGLEQAVHREREILEPLRNQADLVIDTTEYSIHDLRRKIQEKWDAMEGQGKGMRLHLITFGFKHGVPTEADMMLDMRFLPNPYFEENLRPLTGKDPAVASYVLGGEPGRTFIERLVDFLGYTLPLYAEEGRYRLTIAIGCTGGRHRSVAVAEAVHQVLRDQGYAVSLEHRHFELD